MDSKMDDGRTPCKYGSSCYQTNPKHLQKYTHHRKADEETEEDPKTANIKRKHSMPSPENDLSKTSKKQKKLESWFKTPSSGSADEKQKASSPGKDQSRTNNEELTVPSDVDIKDIFGVEMPQDFYSFWDFCKSLNKTNPHEALVPILGLKLVGPYDVLAGKVKAGIKLDRKKILIHQRHYFDPPEFMTTVVSDRADQFHIGYFRDDPKEMPTFAGSNCSKAKRDAGVISILGDNIFSAINQALCMQQDECKDRSKLQHLEEVQEALSEWAEKFEFSLEVRSVKIKSRQKRVVTKSFLLSGLVVPVSDDVGYRDLQHTDGQLKKMFQKIDSAKNDAERLEAFEPLQELITLIQFANDECDYGMGLELGIDMFSFGSKYLHKAILSVLPLAYQLLGRDLYGEVIRAHLDNRDLDHPSTCF